MEDVKLFTIGILAALCFTVGVFFGIDAEEFLQSWMHIYAGNNITYNQR